MISVLKYILLLLLIETVTPCPCGQNSSNNSQELSIRLPSSLLPIHYLIRLQPYINGNFTFSGHVEITFEVKKTTNKIILHISDIVTKNDSTKIYPMDNPNQPANIESQAYDHKRQFYIATLKNNLEEGRTYVIAIDFEGYLNDQLYGFYRSSYKNEEGETVYLATTKFEPTGARKAFPCFDEPSFKAKFSIEMIRPEGLHTISNMPLYDSTPVTGSSTWVLDRFNTSLPMATYLVAFIVSDFGYLEGEGTQNYKFRVWARKNALPTAKFAIDLGPKISRFYETYFEVPFPLPKQDLVAIPDFSSGAMENWGLITFRESSLLYDPEVAKAKDKMNIANTITHELSHQWFGDLVTPLWWTDLWLNEGFASYMEYLGLRDTEPSLNSLDQFVVNEVHSAFALDSLETSHPISIRVERPEEIKSIFDSISYSKGASIIRMMSSFLTEKTFTKGLANYLTELSYKNAEQNDLWRYLTDAGHSENTLDTSMTVKTVMDTWTLQMGYPVVTVSKNEDGSATFSQERFLLSKSTNTTSDGHEYNWWIPLTFTTQSELKFNDTTPKAWMRPFEHTKSFHGVVSNVQDWIIVNLDQVGYYRVNYDDENWEALSSQLSNNPEVFPDVNRAQMIDDALNLARAGQLPYNLVLELLKYLKNEKDFVPITAAFNNLAFIKNMLSSNEEYYIFQNYLLSIIIPLYNDVQFADSLNDPHLVQRKRELVLSWACDLGHKPCVESSVDLYIQWMKDPENTRIISPNQKSTVYCTAIKEGGTDEWNFAWNRYLKTSSGTEQKELLQALGCSQNATVLKEYLSRSLSPDQGIKSQMLRYIYPALASTPVGRKVAWEFLRERWSDLFSLFGSVNFVLDNIISSVTNSLNTQEDLTQMTSFTSKYEGKFGIAERAIEQATENLKNNMQWMTRYHETIFNWLAR